MAPSRLLADEVNLKIAHPLGDWLIQGCQSSRIRNSVVYSPGFVTSRLGVTGILPLKKTSMRIKVCVVIDVDELIFKKPSEK